MESPLEEQAGRRAAVGNGDSGATLLDPALVDPYTDGGTLSGTVRVDQLDPGDTVVVRIDVRATCDPAQASSGILYSVATRRP